MKLRLLFLLNLLLNPLCVTATPLGTAFTYQGRLSDGGAPASGIYDLRFAIYDSTNNTGGIVASPLTNSAVAVSNGLFTTTLDFGEGVFDAADRWLEIGVRTNGSVSAFTALSPRQPLTPAPYALYARNAGAANTATTALTANGVSAANILGTIPDARLSPHVALLNGNANFAGAVTAATFNGSGAGLTNVPASSLTGTIADAQLSANIPRLSVPNTALQATGNPIVTSGFITGATATSGGFGYLAPPAVTVNDTSGSNAVITAAISAEGAVTNLTVQNAGSGYSAGTTLTIAPPPSNAYQVFSSTNYFDGVNLLSNANNVIAGTFTGNGGGLTSVNATTLGGLGARSFWQLGGNSGTAPDAYFLGTTDNQPLELKVQGQRGLRLEPTSKGTPNIIGGASINTVDVGVVGATISGGGMVAYGTFPTTNNHIMGDFGTIGGGGGNAIQTGALLSTIGGGYGNSVQGFISTIAGGYQSAILPDASYSTIGGGVDNTIQNGAFSGTIGGGAGNVIQNNAFDATISGGYQNSILPNAKFATIPGGQFNMAGGSYSFAAGLRAKANHNGAFVWADSQDIDFASTGANQFLVRATGGVGSGTTAPSTQLHVASANQTVAIIDGSNVGGTWLGIGNSSTGGQRWSIISSGSGNGEGAGKLIFFTSQSNSRKMMLDGSGNLTINGTLSQGSDRNVKTAFEPVNTREVLDEVTKLPLMKWAYTNDATVRHLGPMAQDFQAAFGLGADDTHIATVDEEGVALAAIQGLNQKVEQKETEITELKQRLERLEQLLSQQLNGGAQ